MIIKKDMIIRKVGTETILVPLGDALKNHNGLFMLSESACFLWEQLPGCNSVQELANKLYDEYIILYQLLNQILILLLNLINL